MIPEKLRVQIERQRRGDICRSKPEAVNQALEELGIPLNSEFGDFFREYAVTALDSPGSKDELCDLLEPTKQILDVTEFVHETWKLPENYICFSSGQGEGGYLYDRDTGTVWDFDLADRDDFIAGRHKPAWNSFFEFMNWYLTEE
jgi:hypothetical protein